MVLVTDEELGVGELDIFAFRTCTTDILAFF